MGRPFEGIDVLEQIQQGRPPEPRTLFWRARRGERTWRAVRDGPLKYLTRQDADRFEEHLFDLEADPGEKNDLLASRPEQAERLRRLLRQWEQEVEKTGQVRYWQNR
jgi:N-acetylgalactosamine-6-sulfatase